MKTRLMALAICGLILPLNARAEEKNDEKKPAVVKELDLKDLKLVGARAVGKATEPTKITSAEELAKAVKDEDSQAKIKKEVDFTKQYVLFFVWAGSGGDKLTAAAVEGKNEVIFNFVPGRTKDFRAHAHLFVLSKDATFKFASPP